MEFTYYYYYYSSKHPLKINSNQQVHNSNIFIGGAHDHIAHNEAYTSDYYDTNEISTFQQLIMLDLHTVYTWSSLLSKFEIRTQTKYNCIVI